jgi:hypothetical protein
MNRIFAVSLAIICVVLLVIIILSLSKSTNKSKAEENDIDKELDKHPVGPAGNGYVGITPSGQKYYEINGMRIFSTHLEM